MAQAPEFKPDFNLHDIHRQIISPQSKADKLKSYAQWSTIYDSDMLTGGYAIADHIAKQLFDRLPAETTTLNALDIGCGTGMTAPPLLAGAAARGIQVTRFVGVDYSPDMLAKAEPKGLYSELVQHDLNDPMPFAEESFDVWIAGGVFLAGHCGPHVIANIVKSIKIGGIGVFSVRRATYVEEKEIYAKAVKEAGCEIVDDTVGRYLETVEGNYVTIRRVV